MANGWPSEFTGWAGIISAIELPIQSDLTSKPCPPHHPKNDDFPGDGCGLALIQVGNEAQQPQK